MMLATWTTLAAFLLFFFGERIFGSNDIVRVVLDVLALASLAGGLVVRFVGMQRATDGARPAWRKSLILAGVAAFGLLLYVFTLDVVLSSLSPLR